jgi:hypothetical protein
MASAEDIRFLNLSTNCTSIAGRITDGELLDQFGSAVDASDIQKVFITDGVTTVYLEGDSLDGSVSGELTFVYTSPTPFVGLVSVELHDAVNINYNIDGEAPSNEDDADTTLIQTLYTIAPCQIDCCIAKLVDAAIECTCKCDKCKEDLLRAEKVFLMLQAAKFAAEQESNPDHADDMYNKASALCTEVCACGC